MRIRRLATVTLPFLLGITGYIGYEGFLIRQEAAAFRDGRYEEAAKLAEPVAIMRRTLAEQLQAQLAELDQKGLGAAQLPLLEKLSRLAPDAALEQRLNAARVLAAPADTLVIEGARLTDAPAAAGAPDGVPTPPVASAEPDANFRATPVPGKTTPWGTLCRLEHRAPDGTWREFGEGFDGPLGASFELLADGQAVLLAGDEALEHWDLATGHVEPLVTAGPPQFVASQPKGMVVAYSVGTDAGDALYVRDHGQNRRLYPAEGQPLLPWLGFSWAPDGQSIVASWALEPANGEGGLQLVWLSLTGEPVLEETLKGDVDPDPHWHTSPDGRHTLLTLGDRSWIWAKGEPAPVAVEGLDQVLAWSPDGTKLAGLGPEGLVILDAASPERQARAAVPGLLGTFEPHADGVRWEGDRLRVAGRLEAPGLPVTDEPPHREVVLEATLALSLASSRPIGP